MNVDAVQPYVPNLKQIAEGTTSPDNWLQWWDSHESQLARDLSRTWYLYLKPRGRAISPLVAAISSQEGACKILDALGVAHTKSARYLDERKVEYQGEQQPVHDTEFELRNSAAFKQLVDRFRTLGASEPESWAFSELSEGIAQLARFVFLRELWKRVIPEGDRDWIRSCKVPNDDGRGGALRRVLDTGVNRDDLTTVVREMQIDLLREIVCDRHATRL